jgi:hypothetical protein
MVLRMLPRTHLWILNGKVPEACLDVLRWGRWIEDNIGKRHVGDDYLMDGEIRVSTVFLGLDHNYGAYGPPILFETMVFGEPHDAELLGKIRTIRDDLDMCRYSTWDEAEAGHRELVERYRALIAEAKEETARAMTPGKVEK